MKKIWFLMVALLLIVAGCGQGTTNNETVEENQGDVEQTIVPDEFPQVMETDVEKKIVEIETTKGKIVVELYPEAAPKAVENFVTHAENGYYEGIIFHRVMQNFMIQAGDPEGTGRGGESIWGEAFEDEFNPHLLHIRGALSMANAGPSTNGSQFFIVQATEVPDQSLIQMKEAKFPQEIIDMYTEYGGYPSLDYKHTVFGQVTEGMDIVDSIAAVEVGEANKPLEDIVIESLKVIQ